MIFLKIKKLTYKLFKKITGTDNVCIAKHGSYLMSEDIISIIASFFLFVAFAKLLPKEIYGQYRYILSIMTIITVLPAVVQGVARSYEGVLKNAFKTKLK